MLYAAKLQKIIGNTLSIGAFFLTLNHIKEMNNDIDSR